jgi:hypothetical protein
MLARWLGGCCRPASLVVRFLVGAALAAGVLKALAAA